jgi:hypothetical protein
MVGGKMRRVMTLLMDNRLTHTQHQRSRRLRQKNARRVAFLEYDYPAMIEALLFAGLLDVRHIDDEEKVDRAVERLLEILCE